jgi:hypothetical protein
MSAASLAQVPKKEGEAANPSKHGGFSFPLSPGNLDRFVPYSLGTDCVRIASPNLFLFSLTEK